MQRSLAGFAALSFSLVASLPTSAQTVGAGGPGPVTAIDIVLEPDATMVKHAEAANQRLQAMPMLPPEEIAEAVYDLIRDDDAAGVVMGVSLGDTRRVVDPPITLPVTSGTLGERQR